jgi:hypothetical protein
MVFPRLAAVAQDTQRFRVLGVVGDDHPAFAVRAEILARVEAEARQVAHAADAPAAVARAVRLRRILDDEQSVPARDRQNRIHVGRLTVQMYRQDRLRSRRDRRIELRGIERERLRIDVDEDRFGAGVADGRHRRHEGEGHGDDFVARADASGEQRQVQGARARVDGDAMRGADIGGEFRFECRDLVAEDELAAVEHPVDRLVNFVLDGLVLRAKIEERNHTVHPTESSSTIRPRAAMD